MTSLSNALKFLLRSVAIGLLISCISLFGGYAQPASAEAAAAPRYIAADGTDLTAFAQCLPKQLSQPSFKRAIEQSGNDFLQKVFDVKNDYRAYKLDEAEIQHLDCMQQKGVIPQIER
ncbi:hypothetical protein C7271_14450 [filamentous cyanobacterium CCP5]|nr:hypothetical protein C7271_14450 [filamentous cyanobacterium CCP5]